MLASHLHRLGSCLAPGATALLGLMPNRAAQKCRHPCHATSFIFSNATPAALTHAPNGCQHRTHTCTPPHTPRLAHATARARLLPRAMSFAAQYCNPPLSPHMSRHPALPMHGAAAWGPGWPRIVGCCCWLFSVPVGVQSCPLVALQRSPDSDLPCSSPVLRHHSLLAGSDAQAGAAPHPLSGTAAARPCGSGPPFGPRFVCFWHRRTARLRPLSPVPGGPRSIVWHSARSGGSPASIGCRVAVGAPPTPPEWTAPTVAVARLAPCPLPRVAGLARRAGCKLVTHRTGLRGRCPL